MEIKDFKYLKELPSSLKISQPNSNFARVLKILTPNIVTTLFKQFDYLTDYNIRIDVPYKLQYVGEDVLGEVPDYPVIEPEEIEFIPFNAVSTVNFLGNVSGSYILSVALPEEPNSKNPFNLTEYSLNYSGLYKLNTTFNFPHEQLMSVYATSGIMDWTLEENNLYYRSFDTLGYDEFVDYQYDPYTDSYFYLPEAPVVSGLTSYKVITGFSGVTYFEETYNHSDYLSYSGMTYTGLIDYDNNIYGYIEYWSVYNTNNLIYPVMNYDDTRATGISYVNPEYQLLEPFFLADQDMIYFPIYQVAPGDQLYIKYYHTIKLSKVLHTGDSFELTWGPGTPTPNTILENIGIMDEEGVINTSSSLITIVTTSVLRETGLEYKTVITALDVVSVSYQLTTFIEDVYTCGFGSAAVEIFNGINEENYTLVGVPFEQEGLVKHRDLYTVYKVSGYSSLASGAGKIYYAQGNLIKYGPIGSISGVFVLPEIISGLYYLLEHLYVFLNNGTLVMFDPTTYKLNPDTVLLAVNIPVPNKNVSYFNSSFYYSDIYNNVYQVNLDKKYIVNLMAGPHSLSENSFTLDGSIAFPNKLDKLYFRFFRMSNETNLKFFSRYLINSNYSVNNTAKGLENAYNIYKHAVPPSRDTVFSIPEGAVIDHVYITTTIGNISIPNTEYVITGTTFILLNKTYTGTLFIACLVGTQIITYQIGKIDAKTKHVYLSSDPDTNTLAVVEELQEEFNELYETHENFKKTKDFKIDKDVLLSDYVRFSPKIWEID